MKLAPSPRSFPVINHFHYFLGDRLGTILRLQRELGDVVKLKLGPMTTHLLMHPDYARHVLVSNAKNYHKGRTFKKTESYFGQGVATSEGDLWRTQRRLMNPHFKPEALADFVDIKIKVIENSLERWQKSAKDQTMIDLGREFPRIAMEVVARTLFGQGIDQDRISGIIDQVDHILKHTMRLIILPFNVPTWLPSPSNLKFNVCLKRINQTIFEFIEKERNTAGGKNSLLSVLAHAEDPETGERMSTKQIRDEAMTLFLGGIDTTGNTLPWVIYNLVRNESALREVKEEISTVLGSGRPDFVLLRKLEKLQAAILETLRLYPQNYVMARDTYEDDEIGGFFIPRNTSVFISMYAIHRHKDFWPDPLKFDLSRFSNEAMRDRHHNAYNPFGAGQRKCLGSNFALIEMMLILSMMLQKFDVKICNKDEIKPDPRWSLPIKGAVWGQLLPI